MSASLFAHSIFISNGAANYKPLNSSKGTISVILVLEQAEYLCLLPILEHISKTYLLAEAGALGQMGHLPHPNPPQAILQSLLGSLHSYSIHYLTFRDTLICFCPSLLLANHLWAAQPITIIPMLSPLSPGDLK